MNDDLKKKLENILENFNGFTSDMLYNELVCLNGNSVFDKEEFNKFLLGWTLFYNGGLSKRTYIDSLGKVSNVKADNFLKLEKNLKLKFPDWIGIGDDYSQFNEIKEDYIKQAKKLLNEYNRDC